MLILAVAAVLIVAAGFYLWHRSASQSTQTPSPSSLTTDLASQTSDWQTYRNAEYGFEMKFPGQCTIKEQKSIAPYIAMVAVSKCEAPDIYISHMDDLKGVGPASSTFKSFWDYGTDVRFGNNVWRKIFYRDEFGQENVWYALEGKYEIVISFGGGPMGADIEKIIAEQAPQLDLMLSTFSFISSQ